MICAMYLRKSRADYEAEARGEGETLAKHRETLMAVAKARDLTVTDVFSELVSGDTIAERPEMQRLLRAVERGDYDAVLCMDIDRLGRGDGADQSAILKTLKYSDTIVITPYKDYNTRREMDEEFFEYSQFIARSEYKRIKRRMWAGRVASVKEGRWISPKAPFGYRRVRIDNGRAWTLTPEPSEAEAVRSMFAWYASGECGKNTIARRINDMGFRTYGGKNFDPSGIRSMLTNPVYIGKIRWNYRRQNIEMKDGKEIVTRPRSPECILSDGLHPAIVDKDVFDAVQQRFTTLGDSHIPFRREMVNPLSGLMHCAECGRAMYLRPEYQRHGVDATYRCTKAGGCATTAIDAKCVYDALLFTLRQWSEYGDSDDYVSDDTASANNTLPQIRAVSAQITQLRNQLSKLQDLLETGVYSADTYVERSKIINDRIAAASATLADLRQSQPVDEHAAIVRLKPQIMHLLDTWDDSTPAEKNALLRAVVREIKYKKTRRCFRNENPAEYLTLTIYPIVD